ncbi:DUF1064 domain-containing protein [Maritimibacter sp. DP07]|uniref:DUF1064 domain-containing protein n=2 Tax=Maritimibacter harenae TaxID=2606218 RepID=A0A845M4U7_9RHOB|nr:DUF1064 domain-containing protein [Maritimibacter harenae]
MPGRLTAAEFQAMHHRMRAKNKFGAERVELDGFSFDSKREARRWAALKQEQRLGFITGLQRQVSIELKGRDGPLLTPKGRVMRYVADFVYTDAATGTQVVEDAKGHPTKEFKVKRAVLAAMGIEIREV